MISTKNEYSGGAGGSGESFARSNKHDRKSCPSIVRKTDLHAHKTREQACKSCQRAEDA